MTNSPNSDRQPESRPRRPWWRLLLLGGTGVGIVTLVGVVVLAWWVHEKLAPLVETQISQLLKRPVRVGRLERFSLTGLQFGPSSLPATPTDPDRAQAAAIRVGFSLPDLLLRRTLKLDITLVNANAYIEQDANGRWVNTETAQGPQGLIKTEVDAIRIENADAILVPSPVVGQKTSAPLSVKIRNGGVLFQDQNQRITYDLQGEFAKVGTFKLKADSFQPTSEIKVLLQGQNLPVAELARLLKAPGIKLQGGIANGSLTVQLRQSQLTDITGAANFQAVQANINPLKQPLQNATGQVRFKGTAIGIDRFTGNYGSVPIQIAGILQVGPNFNLSQTKFNILGNIPSATAAALVGIAKTELGQEVKLPVPIAGEVASTLRLLGTLSEPVLLGTVAATKPIQLDRLQANTLSANFKLERGRVIDPAPTKEPKTQQSPSPENILVPPGSTQSPASIPQSPLGFSSLVLSVGNIKVGLASGGQIVGKGLLDIALAKGTQSGLVLDVQAQNLEADAIAQLYKISLPQNITLGTISAKTQVFGPLNNLQGRIQWRAPEATYPASGEVRIARAAADLQNVALSIAGGTVNLAAGLNNRRWEALVSGDRLALNRLQQELPFLRLPPGLEGILSGRAKLAGTLDNLSLNTITAQGLGDINIAGGTIRTGGRLVGGRWQIAAEPNQVVVGRLEQILRNTQLAKLPDNLPVTLLNGRFTGEVKAAGNVNDRKATAIAALGNGRLVLEGSAIDVKGELEAGRWLVAAKANDIPLDRLRQTLKDNQVTALSDDLLTGLGGNLSGQVLASGNLDRPANAIKATATGRLVTDQLGTIDASGELANGRWQAFVATEKLAVSRLERSLKQANLLTADLPSELEGVLNGRARFSGTLNNGRASAIDGIAQGQLNLANGGGVVNARGRVEGGRWRAAVSTDRLALSPFQGLWNRTRSQLQAQGLANQGENATLAGVVSGDLDLTGPLAFTPESVRAVGRLRVSELPILKQPFATAFNWDGKRVQVQEAVTPGFAANGSFGVNFAGRSQPAIGNLDFNVRLSDFDLTALRLPVPSGLAPIQNNSPLLAGRADFAGRLSGETVSQANLAGDLRLRGLAVNGVAFDPVLTGPVNLGLGQGTEVRLAGQQDRIEVALNPRFLPTSFLIRRGESIASGRTEGDTLQVDFQEFPLAALNLAPAKQAGLGLLTGQVSGQINVPGWKLPLNPSTLQASGQIAIVQPTLGHIRGDRFQTQFTYANGVASIANGELRVKQSQYLVSGTAKIGADPQFAGNVKVQQGNLQDILVALQYFNFKDLARGFQPPTYGTASDVQTIAVGNANAPLIDQLRRLAEIEALLKQQRDAQAASKVPPLSELQGVFGGEVSVAGSLKTGLQAQFNVKGNDWRWGDYKADLFSLQGSFQEGNLTVLPLEIKSGEGTIGFSGQIGQKVQSGQLRVANFPVQELAKLVELPYVDVTGNLNLRAAIAGSLANPQATGELTLTEGTLNREPIEKAEGSFSYNNARLNFSGSALVTQTEPIDVIGSLPVALPFASVKPDNNQIDLRLNVKNEGLAIINVLTPQIAWVGGQGQVQVQVGGTLDRPVAEGIAQFENATLKAQAFPDPLTGLTGRVRFEGDRLRVEGVQGQLSKGQVTAAGVIPLSTPLAESDRDLETPLTVVLDKLALNLRGLYQGGAVGRVIVGGTALNPQLGGGIDLYDGQVFLSGAGAAGGTGRPAPSASPSPSFEVGLNSLQLNLKRGIRVTSPPLLSFLATGGLVVNGSLDEIRPQGTIRLTAGAVNLFTTQFRLERGYPQTATFIPSQGLDPTLDVRLVTSVPEVTRFITPSSGLPSEIADVSNTSNLGSVRSVRINAIVQGRASQLTENLELRSSPNRSQAEIVALLGGSFVETLGQGDSTLAIANLAGAGIFGNLQSAITSATGLSEFRLFPTRIRTDEARASSASPLGLGLEVGVDITRNISASIIRVLAAGQPTEFTLRYRLNQELLLRGSTDFQGDNRATVEYEMRF